jgi:hypothetical protein
MTSDEGYHSPRNGARPEALAAKGNARLPRSPRDECGRDKSGPPTCTAASAKDRAVTWPGPRAFEGFTNRKEN